jgi:hypothetical protein
LSEGLASEWSLLLLRLDLMLLLLLLLLLLWICVSNELKEGVE